MVQVRHSERRVKVKAEDVDKKPPRQSINKNQDLKDENTAPCVCKKEKRELSPEGLLKLEERDNKPKKEELDTKTNVKLEAKKEEEDIKPQVVREGYCTVCGEQLDSVGEGSAAAEVVDKNVDNNQAGGDYSNPTQQVNSNDVPMTGADGEDDPMPDLPLPTPRNSPFPEQQTDSPVSELPKKRQRLIMDAVVLPAPLVRVSQTLSPQLPSLSPAPQVIIDDDNFEDVMQQMKNPNVKKKEGFNLGLDSIRERLVPIGLGIMPTGVDRNISETYFERNFLSAHWGGSPQATFPAIGKAFLETHGLDDFMCITLDHHPHAPEIPGAPGLYFAPGHNEHTAHAWEKPARLITRIRPSQWQYHGQYQMTPSKCMTRQEWLSQSQKCRDSWAYEIWSKEWGIDIRAEIYLTKQLGRRPTGDEINQDVGSREEEKGPYQNLVTIEEIGAALSDGRLPVGVFSMKCVGYDKKFSAELHRHLAGWPELKAEMGRKRKEEKVRKKAGAGQRKGVKTVKQARKPVGKKRKRTEEDGEEEDENQEDESYLKSDGEDGALAAEFVHYVSRGTRSRPMVVE